MKTDDPEVQEVRRVLERQIRIRDARIKALEVFLDMSVSLWHDPRLVLEVLNDETWKHGD
jgi:hypothetical protein